MNDTVDMQRQARAWFRHLHQDTTWIPKVGGPILIRDMDSTWRYNAANWLLRRACELSIMYSFGEFAALTSPISGPALRQDSDGTAEDERPLYLEMPPEVLADLLQQDAQRAENPESWLKTTPLYRALVKDLPGDVAALAKHWSTCDLRTGQGTVCSCWMRHLSECPVNMLRDITANCQCRDNSPEWTI
ncbi:hypothetical protein [Nonomuraea sp. SYSU D8015]|uniref:hypothetical protein n=1 Tax=Nonomuraea sp. SYSU D8015 TaxID=2593644 RepID=UPI0016617BB1|nr:hypothetical protein [Nonomuraea sp. SYSU D8015]